METDPAVETIVVPSDAVQGELRRELLSLLSLAYEEDFAEYYELLSPGVHVFARLGGQLVSHVAWVERELRAGGVGSLRTAYVEAVATAPRYQRRGYASSLLGCIPQLVGDYALAALSPSDARFYRRLGWELWSGPLTYIDRDGLEVPCPEEQVMIHRLPLTPAALDPRAKLTAAWRPLEVW